MKITTAMRLAKRKNWYFYIPGLFAYRFEDKALACYSLYENKGIEHACNFDAVEQNIFNVTEISSNNWYVRPSFEKRNRKLQKADRRTKYLISAKNDRIDFDLPQPE
jgi:hypothetical protein